MDNAEWVILIFLKSEGNVFSVGKNQYGQLGLGHNRSQNVLNKVKNIPPIKMISCARISCYLIDFEGNVYSFGNNGEGQLGHGDKSNLNIPKIIYSVTDIQYQGQYNCPIFKIGLKNIIPCNLHGTISIIKLLKKILLHALEGNTKGLEILIQKLEELKNKLIKNKSLQTIKRQ